MKIYKNTSPIVTSNWLAENLDKTCVKVVDATYVKSDTDKSSFDEYITNHIQGAAFFDFNLIRDLDTKLPIMLPSCKKFSYEVSKLGISNSDTVIIYDRDNYKSLAARAWWMFRVFGHEKVFVLDGGLNKWISERKPVEAGIAQREGRNFNGKYNPSLVTDLSQMREIVDNQAFQIIDTRSVEHFNGEPSPFSKKTGHIPRAKNLPMTRIVDINNNCLQSNDHIAKELNVLNIDKTRPLVLYCGAAGSAPVLALALHKLGLKHIPVYDGSWAEWGSQEDTPIEI